MRLPLTKIRRLRARVPRRLALTARRDLERLLVACESPANLLPPGAILCIRAVRDPLPHTLRLGEGFIRPPVRWREAMERQWGEFLAVAVRPALGPAGSAPSVLFASEAELLTCLAVAATKGRLQSEWWWPGLLRPEEVANWLLRWFRRPQMIPSAVVLLAAMGELPEVARGMPTATAHTLWEVLTRHFGLVHLASVQLGSPAKSESNGGAETRTGVESEETRLATSFGDVPFIEAPTQRADSAPPAWTTLLPELCWFDAAPEMRAWVAVALLLERAPQVPRKPSFPEALARWLAEPEVPLASDPTTSPTQRDQQPSSSEPTARIGPPNTSIGTAGTPAQTFESETVQQVSGYGTAPPTEPKLAVDEGTLRGICASPPQATPVAGNPPVPAGPELPQISVAQVATEFGGSFYLLNVALSLGLYGDFTQPLKRGLALSPWDLLALIGTRVVGDAFDRDPLAGALARWAGRPADESPGAHFVPPSSTLSTLNSQPSTPSPTEQSSLDLWLDRLIEQFESRLRLALPSWEPHQVLPRLLRQRAVIESFDRVIRVRFDLEDHPLPVRLAGLDRDPGWIPAGGWSVTFLYETRREGVRG